MLRDARDPALETARLSDAISTVLVYWRDRIRTSPKPRGVFQAVRQVVEATGGAIRAGPAGAGLHRP
jgi:hypothetical protein